MRVLVADDDRTSAAIVASSLRQWGFDVTVATNGNAAWDVLSAQRPPLAILDWMMPGMSGVELCRRVRSEPALAMSYVILLTARDAGGDRIAGLDAGADDYLTKPFVHDELRARVHVGARVAGMQIQLAEQVAQLQQALATVKQLEGLLPICSYCKRIRTDEHSWQQMESYISAHSNAQFSHGVCPSCFEKVREEFGFDKLVAGHDGGGQ